MANQEHIDILKKGVDVWNFWRKSHFEVQPDLSGADLSRINLMSSNLRNTILIDANLSEANLIEADLRDADLNGADLSDAHVWNTNFGNVDLSVVKGLEWVDHVGPSTIGIDTIY